jgi:hypothetical protein
MVDTLSSTVAPRLGVLAFELSDSKSLADLLRSPELTIQIGAPPDLGVLKGTDLLVVRVPTGNLGILSWALESHVALEQPEYVFVLDGASDPAGDALLALGVTRVLSLEKAPGWIKMAAGPLAEAARSRRALRRALARIPALPPPDEGSDQAPCRLFEAEQRFREAYVRALTARVRSRADAANQAGVPYRTFSQILNKLGIDPIRNRNGSRPF